jgi:ABC-type polysaccharide/polyol phosphate transport system ATPase subunit
MPIIELENVSLTYPVYGTNARSFKASLVNMATGGRLDKNRGTISVEALKNVSIQLEKGDRLALLGHNGAGKSTLLKVLAQIYQPTKGVVKVEGRSSCLFDILMGMEHELNGYENIRLRGLILGLSKTETRKIIPQVEEFAELGDFMKMPIKTYSAGMKVRLAFGIITTIFSEILLIDEIVNVGDAGFVEKAKARMKSFVNQSEVLVLSTHDLLVAKEFCNKALWLDQGQVRGFGKVEEVLRAYTQGG